MEDLENVHDKFFKEVFSRKETAKDFLETYSPLEVKGLINTEKIKIHKDSFVEKELKEFFSDILYEVEIKSRPAFIYFLFEHKSYPERFVAFHLLRYMIKLWELLLKQKRIKDRFFDYTCSGVSW